MSSEYEIELAEPAEQVYRKLCQQAPACAGTCSQMKTPGLTLNIFASFRACSALIFRLPFRASFT